MSNIQAIIFDFDGTLYDYKGLTPRVLSQIPFTLFTANYERKVRHYMQGCYFETYDAFKQEFFQRFSEISGKSVKKLEKWYFSKYLPAMMKALKKYFREKKRPDVEKVFNSLKDRGVKTAVFSDYSMVEGRMEAVGIDPKLADGVFSAEDFGGLKPAKEPFLKIADIFGVEPQNILVVGDRNDTDGDGARASGMQFLQIKTHKTKPEDIDSAVEWEEFVKRLPEL